MGPGRLASGRLWCLHSPTPGLEPPFPRGPRRRPEPSSVLSCSSVEAWVTLNPRPWLTGLIRLEEMSLG